MYKCRIEQRGGIGFGESDVCDEELKWYLYNDLKISELAAMCGDRVVQMTKTYNDIDAVTRLLEEKEQDLELAAKIGQSLLEQNKHLEKRIDSIEEQLTLATDQNTQLKHDMKLKIQLLQIYTNEVGFSDSDDDSAVGHDRALNIPSKFINVEVLQKKVRTLEEENFQLRMETAEMNSKTVTIEEKEAQLVHDAFKLLGEAQGREGVLTEELNRRLEETYQQKEEITCLLAQAVELQQKVKRLSIENEELQIQCRTGREAQNSLTKELQEALDKCDEYFNMLNEARTEVREIHRRSLPQSNLPRYNPSPLPVFPPDSLAAELVDSVEHELVGGQPRSKRVMKRENKNIMKTVKTVNRSVNSRAPSEYSLDMYGSQRTSPGSSVLSLANRSATPMSEQYEGDNESNLSGSVQRLGFRSIPGANDLESALRRLNLRKQNEEAEQKYADEERDYGGDDVRTPTCPTPGSIWSTESFGGLVGTNGHGFRSFMPEKLQIVKPMEGSLTLYHWQRLATPHMASMLDIRPGVMVKGFRELERDPAVYSMDDVEDDGCVTERTCVPSKCFMSTCSTYTYTTSTIGLMDNTQLTASNRRPKMSDTHHISMKPVASKTFSTSLGLAQVLNERGVDAEQTGNTIEPKVLTKVEAAAINPAGVNAGLNMFGGVAVPPPPPPPTKSASESSRESSAIDEPSPPPVPTLHRISSRIFSRFAVPIRSRNITDALDPETKTRLLEKVRKIRAEKETNERRARTLQRGVPSVRTRDPVMSPVRIPKTIAAAAAVAKVPVVVLTSSTATLSAEVPCMGLEGAVGGYSPPGMIGALAGGLAHRGATTSKNAIGKNGPGTKNPRRLFSSDDSGIELGFGGSTPGSSIPRVVSTAPWIATPAANPAVTPRPLAPASSTYTVPRGGACVLGLGSLISTSCSSDRSSGSMVSSRLLLSSGSGQPTGAPPIHPVQGGYDLAMSHGRHIVGHNTFVSPSRPPVGSYQGTAGSATMSFSSGLSSSSGAQGLISMSASASGRPLSSVVPMTSPKVTPSGAPPVGLGALSASRPTVLSLSRVAACTTETTRTVSSSVKRFQKPGHPSL